MLKWFREFALLGPVLVAGCFADPPVPPPPQAATDAVMNEDAIIASVSNGVYRYSPQFAPINRQPYESTAAKGSKINVWVTTSDFTAYSKVDPDKSGSNVKLPTGAMIVREVLAADGSVAKLTLMTKGPPGYNPELGDYWFGVTEPNGTPLQENGAKLTGKLTQCYSCHTPRTNDDYLFGVPQAPRVPPAGPPPPDMAPSVGTTPPTTTPPHPTAPPPPPPTRICGDFYCEPGESCLSCPSDCGVCGSADDHGGGR
jgi:hypothetical protein